MCTRTFDPNRWLSYIYYYFFVCATIRLSLRVLTYLFFLYAHDHLDKTCVPLPIIITSEYDHLNKIRVLIYIFISFVQDHSTKIRGHSYSLIYLLTNCINILYATFMTVLIYFVNYIHGIRTGIHGIHDSWLIT